MRICRDCNVEMLEDDRMYMTSCVSGSSITYGSMIKIEKRKTFLQNKFGFVAGEAICCKLNTALCPVCGLAETYLSQNNLNEIKSYLK